MGFKLSDYKLSDHRFLDKLEKNTEVYGPIKFEEVVTFVIDTGLQKRITADVWGVNPLSEQMREF